MKIDKLDNKMIDLLAERLKLSNRVAVYKFHNGKKVRDRKRERAMVASRIKKARSMGINNGAFVSKLFSTIMDESVNAQKEKLKELKKK